MLCFGHMEFVNILGKIYPKWIIGIKYLDSDWLHLGNENIWLDDMVDGAFTDPIHIQQSLAHFHRGATLIFFG